jgi:hypothetical protein
MMFLISVAARFGQVDGHGKTSILLWSVLIRPSGRVLFLLKYSAKGSKILRRRQSFEIAMMPLAAELSAFTAVSAAAGRLRR